MPSRKRGTGQPFHQADHAGGGREQGELPSEPLFSAKTAGISRKSWRERHPAFAWWWNSGKRL